MPPYYSPGPFRKRWGGRQFFPKWEGEGAEPSVFPGPEYVLAVGAVVHYFEIEKNWLAGRVRIFFEIKASAHLRHTNGGTPEQRHEPATAMAFIRHHSETFGR